MEATMRAKVLGWKIVGGLVWAALSPVLIRVLDDANEWQLPLRWLVFLGCYGLIMAAATIGLHLMFDERYAPFSREIRVIGGLVFVNQFLALVSYTGEWDKTGSADEMLSLAYSWSEKANMMIQVASIYLMFGGRRLWKNPKEYWINRVHFVRVCGVMYVFCAIIYVWWFNVFNVATAPREFERIPYVMYFCSTVLAGTGIYLMAGAPGLAGKATEPDGDMVLWRDADDIVLDLLRKRETSGQ